MNVAWQPREIEMNFESDASEEEERENEAREADELIWSWRVVVENCTANVRLVLLFTKKESHFRCFEKSWWDCGRGKSRIYVSRSSAGKVILLKDWAIVLYTLLHFLAASCKKQTNRKMNRIETLWCDWTPKENIQRKMRSKVELRVFWFSCQRLCIVLWERKSLEEPSVAAISAYPKFCHFFSDSSLMKLFRKRCSSILLMHNENLDSPHNIGKWFESLHVHLGISLYIAKFCTSPLRNCMLIWLYVCMFILLEVSWRDRRRM